MREREREGRKKATRNCRARGEVYIYRVNYAETSSRRVRNERGVTDCVGKFERPETIAATAAAVAAC